MIISYIKSKSFLVPLTIWAGFILVVTIGFELGASLYNSIVPTLIIWDAEHYFSIASQGYQMFPCDWNPEAVCGNVGWFPFYPLLAKVLGWIGLDHRFGLLGLSWVSLFASMLLIYRMVLNRFGENSALFSLLALVTFPSAFYFLTAFPYALYLLLAVSILYTLEHKIDWLLIPLTGCLTVTYPSGAVVGFPLLYALLTRFARITVRARIVLAGAIVSIGVAMFIYFSYYWFAFGDFFLYTKIHSQYYYAHGISFPFIVFYDVLTQLTSSSPVFVIVAFLLITLPLFYNHRLPVSWQIYMWSILLFTPTMGTCDCYYRHIVVAFPMFIMIGTAVASRWRKYLLIPYVVVSLWLGWSVYFAPYKIGLLM